MDKNLIEVSKKTFFKKLFEDKRNIHPRITSNKWDAVTGYTTEFRTQDIYRRLFGITIGNDRDYNKYYLAK